MDFRLPQTSPSLDDRQYQFLNQKLNFILPPVFTIQQVHGDRIVLAEADGDKSRLWEQADGILTDIPNLPIAVRTADCFSVFLYDPKHESIGVIHAGWRGTQKNILVRAIEHMHRRWGTHPENLRVTFGPAIRSCCYQVGPEFLKYFPQEVTCGPNGYFLDLLKANIGQLVQAGVDSKNIFDSNICTCCDEQYFSYRREGQAAGRMLSLMMLRIKEC